MDRKEKKEKRAFIGEHLDIENTRLRDEEADFLSDFIENYDEEYKGQTMTETNSFTSWSSDGKYRREEETTYTFSDDVGICEEYKYQDDDGQKGGNIKEIKDARGILNWFKKNE